MKPYDKTPEENLLAEIFLNEDGSLREEYKTLDDTPYLTCDLCGAERHNEQIDFKENLYMRMQNVCKNKTECADRMSKNYAEFGVTYHE